MSGGGKSPRATRRRPTPQAPAPSRTQILVGDQIAAAASSAAALVPGARQAQVVDPAGVTGTPAEQLRFYEAAIDAAAENHRNSMAAAKARVTVEIGMALQEIRSRDLYKVTHATFESYVEQRFQLSRQRAYQILEAAPVMFALTKIFDTPLAESHGRILAPVMEQHGIEAAKAVVAKAQEAGKVTGASLRDARKAAGFAPEPSPRAASSNPRSSVFERLQLAQERLTRVSAAVTRTAVHDANAEHPAHARRLVLDLTDDLVSIANALGLTVSRNGSPLGDDPTLDA
ncbi:hypothetical protein [Embleya hyalina]|uniref:Uncharacterized protein n=1 Tax=Embleya hyalina TaxID=516124 RepID=A0A401Z409_9ACTN|nr:hypothetical protein [Embleya hyalina]GCE01577.1 hypothetical protein EHYA_09343 [Embleya hyalina]